jgi:hypothetical protein
MCSTVADSQLVSVQQSFYLLYVYPPAKIVLRSSVQEGPREIPFMILASGGHLDAIGPASVALARIARSNEDA